MGLFTRSATAPVPAGHPSAETRNLIPDDTLLRKHGFRVRSRPRKGPPTWSLAGKTYTEAEALALCAEPRLD